MNGWAGKASHILTFWEDLDWSLWDWEISCLSLRMVSWHSFTYKEMVYYNGQVLHIFVGQSSKILIFYFHDIAISIFSYIWHLWSLIYTFGGKNLPGLVCTSLFYDKLTAYLVSSILLPNDEHWDNECRTFRLPSILLCLVVEFHNSYSLFKTSQFSTTLLNKEWNVLGNVVCKSKYYTNQWHTKHNKAHIVG